MRTLFVTLAALAAGTVACEPANAAEAWPRKSAQNVVTGTITAVYVRETRDKWYYIVEIKVEEVEKGELKEGDTCRATYSQFRRRNDVHPNPAGPKEGQRVKAFFDQQGRGAYPKWMDALPPSVKE
jgi:hypothetical protein